MSDTKPLSLTKNISYAALAVAAGVLLPQIAHLAGGRALGNLLLPMHLPVLLAGFLLKRYWGAMCGAVIPLISFFITGMPPVPRLAFMMIELFTYGLLTGLFYRKAKLSALLSLVLAMTGGRILYFVSLAVVLDLFGMKLTGFISPWLAVSDAVVAGLPGIILQIILIPSLLFALKKGGLLND